MTREFATAVRLVIATVVICGVVYPAVILVFATLAAPQQRLGSLIDGRHDVPVGSRLVAQPFRRPEYFWPRPSAVGYDASAAGGSNLSPHNPLLRKRAEEILGRLALPQDSPVPADLMAASGSGLDPHLSLAAALVQVPRLANCRRISENSLRQFVRQHAEWNAPLALGGEPLINVLRLNLALDETYPVP